MLWKKIQLILLNRSKKWDTKILNHMDTMLIEKNIMGFPKEFKTILNDLGLTTSSGTTLLTV